ncbi:MAG: HAMP domain-containing sensor histidine kinase [Candidatus Pacebacteria bacterium]|nr:HAMP domain-containing sensor histidine kinase [Candidatus Paceibacterota bacterium]
MPFPEINQFLIIIINLISLLVLYLVLKEDVSNRSVKTTFLLTIFFMLSWVNFAYLARALAREDAILALSLLKVAWVATPLLFISIYFLLVNIFEKKYYYKRLNRFVLFMGTITAIIIGITDFVLNGLRFVDGYMGIEYGQGMIPFFSTITFFIIATTYIIKKEYYVAPPETKTKIQHLIVGIFIFYIANIIFNITLPVAFNIVHIYWLGDYSTIILISLIAYSIIKKELFEVRVAITGILISLIGVLLFIDVAFLTENWGLQVVKAITFLFFIIFGYLLMGSITREIKQREQVEQLVERLERANEDLRAADKAKSEFISIASHQLRTPLTSTKGYLSMIADGTYGKVPPKIKEKTNCVFKSNERLIKLVNELLNVSRIETGKIKYEPEKRDLEKVLGQVVQEFRIVTKEKGLTLKFKKPKEKLPEMLLDEEKLRQVLLNIIDNGIKYTPKGGITVSLEKKNDNALITIIDTGEGIAKEDLDKMFQSFSRGSTGVLLSSEGAGLGLYIARKFIEMHDGKIWAESKGLKKGSKFYIQIPIK